MPENDPDVKVVDASVAILSDTLEIIEEASLHDLFMTHAEMLVIQDIDVANLGSGPFVDLFQPNSVEWLTSEPNLVHTHEIYTGNKVLICERLHDTIVIIDWETLEPVWAWGRGELSMPHCATLLPNGHIMVFDNGRLPPDNAASDRKKCRAWQFSSSRNRDLVAFARTTGDMNRRWSVAHGKRRTRGWRAIPGQGFDHNDNPSIP